MRKLAVVMVCLLAPGLASAETYDLHVTRVGQDLYKIEGTGQTVYIQTAYCYEYATWGEAVLVLNSQPFQGSIDIGKLIFTDSGTTCQVNTVLQ